ncbi:MAG TPA: hypothetical protein VHW09_12170 [Bryobacteraceae bacterium]|nr:hypothetical protein [Bryobacteraceae bacterium]
MSHPWWRSLFDLRVRSILPVCLLAWSGIPGPACAQTVKAVIAPLGFCDVNQDGAFDVVDAEAVLNQAFSPSQVVNDLDADGKAGVGDVQIAVNAALGMGCTAVRKISILNPNTAAQKQTLTVVFTVANFVLSTPVVISFSDPHITVQTSSLNLLSATQVSVTVVVAGTAAIGASDVTIAAGGDSVGRVAAFTVTSGSAAISSLDPGSAGPGTTASIAVNGANTSFQQGATTASFGAGVTVNSVTVQSQTSATVNISVDPAATLGLRTVTLRTGDETAVLDNVFGVGFPAVLTSISPTAVGVGLPSTIRVTGSNLAEGRFTFALPAVLPSFCGEDDPPFECTPPAATVVSNDGATAILNVTGGSFTGDFALIITTIGGSTSGAIGNLNRMSVVTTNSAWLPSLAVFNNGIDQTLLPVLPAGLNDVRSAEVSVQNQAAGSSSPLPAGENGAYFFASVFNNAIVPSLLPQLAAGVNSALSSAVSVLNGLIDPARLPALPAGSNGAYFTPVSVRNSATSSMSLSLSRRSPVSKGVAAVPTVGGLERGARGIAGTPTAYAGQTLHVTLEGADAAPAELRVNGVVVRGRGLADTFFTVPYGVDDLTLQWWIEGHDFPATSQESHLRVFTDPAPPFAGELQQTGGEPASGRPVAWSAGAFTAEVFPFAEPLVSLPDLEGRKPVRQFLATAVNQLNPNAAFGGDPLGLGTTADVAVRYRSRVLADRGGLYRFWLRSNGFVSLQVGEQRIAGHGDLWMIANLGAGLHDVEVVYAKGVGPESIELSWAPPVPGAQRQPVSPYYLRTPGEDAARSNAAGLFTLPAIPLALDSIWIDADRTTFPVERRQPDATPVRLVLPANPKPDNR